MSDSTHLGEDDHSSQPDRDGSGWPSRFRVEMVAETGSTNADLVERALAGEPGGLVLRTDHQTEGRGRLDRRWDAPPGTNLLFSVLLRPGWPVERLMLVTSCMAVALVDVLGPRLDERTDEWAAMVKWPNDVLLVDRASGEPVGKVSGILAEMVARPAADGAGSPAVVVGMGVDVAWPGPGDDAPPGAVSLAGIGVEVEPPALLDEVLEAFDGRLTVLGGADGPASLRDAHRERSATVGRMVRAERDGEDLVGTAVDVGVDGSLVVEVADGSIVRVMAGDVVHLRVD